MKIKNITFIGSGNVATHLSISLQDKGINIVEIWSKNTKSALLLSEKLKCNYITDLNNLSPGLRSIKFTTKTDVEFEFKYNIKEGPEDILSTYTHKLLGSPKIKNKTVATLLQYNTVYMKIGIVTILISLLVMLISPYLRKLMHGVK